MTKTNIFFACYYLQEFGRSTLVNAQIRFSEDNLPDKTGFTEKWTKKYCFSSFVPFYKKMIFQSLKLREIYKTEIAK